MKYITSIIRLQIFMFFVLISSSLYAQTESISYGEEMSDSSDYNYRKTYQYLDIKLKNEKWLLKFSPFFNIRNRNPMKEVSLELSLERKLANEFSMQVFTKTWIAANHFEKGLFGNLSLELRYYPGMNKRIAKNLSGNNLSGFYLSLGISNLLRYSAFKPSIENTYFYNWAYPDFNIGYQSRLNNWAYLDVFAIIGYKTYNPNLYLRSDNFYSTLGFRLGFAWGNNK